MASKIKKEAKKKASVQRSGKRLVKSALRQVKKADKDFSASGGRKYAKSITRNTTASNFETEGRSRMATGVKTAKKKDLKVTPRSEQKHREAENPYLKAQKRGAGKATTKRPKRK